MSRGFLAAIAVTFAMLGAPGAAAAQSGGDIADQLRAIPGMTLIEERTAPAPYRFFVLSYRQPADHEHPRKGSFEQRLTLLHKRTDRPMVLHTSGYNVRISPTRSEPTRLVDGNQISVEQRFFAPSRPEPADWSKLNIWQAATDHHRLAFNMRVIPTHVPAYTNKKYYRSVYNGGKYHLDKWGVALLRGEDRLRVSRAIPPADLETGEFTRVIPPGEPLPVVRRRAAA